MSFMMWLIAQRARLDLVGEIAQQVARRQWVDSDYILTYRVRLALEDATPLAYRALILAWQEWEASRHLPEINMWGPKGLN